MAEETIDPLLALVHEQGLLDDLQFEEIAEEFRRSATPVFQLLQDNGVMDADAILQVMANQLATEVVQVPVGKIPKEVLDAVSAEHARAFECIPLSDEGGILRVAFVDPLNQRASMNWGTSRARKFKWLWPIPMTSARRSNRGTGRRKWAETWGIFSRNLAATRI